MNRKNNNQQRLLQQHPFKICWYFLSNSSFTMMILNRELKFHFHKLNRSEAMGFSKVMFQQQCNQTWSGFFTWGK